MEVIIFIGQTLSKLFYALDNVISPINVSYLQILTNILAIAFIFKFISRITSMDQIEFEKIKHEKIKKSKE